MCGNANGAAVRRRSGAEAPLRAPQGALTAGRCPTFLPPMEPAEFRYFLEMTRAEGGASLGQFEVDLDLDPIVEWARFKALRRWGEANLAAQAQIRIQPIWHAKTGAPYAQGLCATARADGVPAVEADIPFSYFKTSAMRQGDLQVNQKRLKPGELFTYTVLAFPAAEAQAKKRPNPLDIEEVPVPVRLHDGLIAEERERAIAFGEIDPELIPVFVPQTVVDEVIGLTERAEAFEVGSVLIGKLCRDSGSGELFLKITAQIPARHTLQESTKLCFTPETWAAAQAAIELRRADEHCQGFFHSHPARYWCNQNCSPEAKLQCPLGKPFFSSQDCDFHRVCFSQPHCVALLVTNTFAGMKLTMYGWDRAVITQRGFHITKPDTARPLPLAEAASIIGANIHETNCRT